MKTLILIFFVFLFVSSSSNSFVPNSKSAFLFYHYLINSKRIITKTRAISINFKTKIYKYFNITIHKHKSKKFL